MSLGSQLALVMGKASACAISGWQHISDTMLNHLNVTAASPVVG
jgi:hypothetical protein